MNKFIFLPILIIVIFAGLIGGRSFYDNFVIEKSSTISNSSSVVNIASPTPTVAARIFPPQRLIVQKIGVNAEVESVGLDSQKRMDVPKKAANVGWYNLGAKVGELGSVVLAGHFDDINGDPAVFYNLSKVKIGDEVSLVTEDGKTFKYKITRKELFEYDKLPLTEIFASSDKMRLNLITCDGYFDSINKNYSKRLVVYSEAID